MCVYVYGLEKCTYVHTQVHCSSPLGYTVLGLTLAMWLTTGADRALHEFPQYLTDPIHVGSSHVHCMDCIRTCKHL